MKFKRIICCLMALVMLLISTTAYAGTNWDSGDAGELSEALDGENVWLIRDSSGRVIECAEGLRVTIYDAENETKVYNTIDISGNSRIAGVSDICYFADNGTNELIPKTTWLEAGYIGTTYNDATAASTIKFHNKVASKVKINGYRSEYVPALASLTIISEDNTANLEAIRSLIGDENFLKNLCDLISGLEYDDFADGKYKIAFEPIAYMTIAGSAWVLTATECGILDKYMLDILNSNKGALLSKMGPLTHSQLPLSAFLSYKELGIQKFAASDNDITYSGSGAVRYRNHCIIRSMGIGIVAGSSAESDMPEQIDTTSEYHTDTKVYTAVTFYNDTSMPYLGFDFKDKSNLPIDAIYDWDSGEETVYATSFDVYYNTGELIRTESELGLTSKESYYIKAGTYDIAVANMTSEEYERFIENKRKQESNKMEEYEKALKEWLWNGCIGEEPTMPSSNIPNYIRGGIVHFLIQDSNGRTIADKDVSVCCPAEEETIVYLEWQTPATEQTVTIEVTTDAGILIHNNKKTDEIHIEANIVKVDEIPPPDPSVYDKRPSWHQTYTISSIKRNLSEYVKENITELTWTQWECKWKQDVNQMPFTTYYGFNEEYTFYGVSGRPSKNSVFHKKCVYVSEIIPKKYTVQLEAKIKLKPADECKTATYSSVTDQYTMKSGYGIQIFVDTQLFGNGAVKCTGSQIANILFPEFNYNRQDASKYNRLLEKTDNLLVFKQNEYSTYNSRVHFTPIWYPDNKYYTIYAEVFDVWCPAGQLSVRLTDSIKIKGNVYDDWHIAPVKP